jgi:hypothetical protein
MRRRARIACTKYQAYFIPRPSTVDASEGGGLKKGARKICKPQRREEILHAVIHIPPGEKFLLYQQALERGNRFFRFAVKSLAGTGISSLSVLIVSWCFRVLLAIN